MQDETTILIRERCLIEAGVPGLEPSHWSIVEPGCKVEKLFIRCAQHWEVSKSGIYIVSSSIKPVAAGRELNPRWIALNMFAHRSAHRTEESFYKAIVLPESLIMMDYRRVYRPPGIPDCKLHCTGV